MELRAKGKDSSIVFLFYKGANRPRGVPQHRAPIRESQCPTRVCTQPPVPDAGQNGQGQRRQETVGVAHPRQSWKGSSGSAGRAVAQELSLAQRGPQWLLESPASIFKTPHLAILEPQRKVHGPTTGKIRWERREFCSQQALGRPFTAAPSSSPGLRDS